MLKSTFELKQKLKNQSPGLALDIDETLSRTIDHFIENLFAEFGNPENLTVAEVINKYRYTHNVPYWQNEETQAFLEELRNSNELQTRLPLIDGAVETVKKINEIIPIVAYITVRPVGVVAGTRKWLNKHGFPNAPVIAKPDYVSTLSGNMWKADVLNYLYPEITGIVDDNPGIVKSLDKDYQGKIFLYNYPDEVSAKNVYPCKDWKQVLETIKKLTG